MLGLAVLVAVFTTTMATTVDVVQPPIVMENNFGFIESPGFPNGYDSELNMTWVIETQPGFVVEIDFTDFYLEASYDEDLGGKCVYDYVTISDGDETERLCGVKGVHSFLAPSNKPYISDTNRVVINFVSDYSNDDPKLFGFRLYYSKVDANECNLMKEGELFPDLNWDEALYCNQHCVNFPGSYQCACKPGFELDEDKHTCKVMCEDEVLTGRNGTITSNGYPSKYSKYANCKWTIEAMDGHSIVLQFNEEFWMEEHDEEDDCPYDRLTIEYVNIDGIDVKDYYCGDEAPLLGDSMRTRAKKVNIVFTSDRTLEGKGFSVTYFNEPDDYNYY